LRCRWCDTKYAYENGNEISVDEVINSVEANQKIEFVGAGLAPAQKGRATARVAPTLVEITGGSLCCRKRFMN